MDTVGGLKLQQEQQEQQGQQEHDDPDSLRRAGKACILDAVNKEKAQTHQVW